MNFEVIVLGLGNCDKKNYQNNWIVVNHLVNLINLFIVKVEDLRINVKQKKVMLVLVLAVVEVFFGPGEVTILINKDLTRTYLD